MEIYPEPLNYIEPTELSNFFLLFSIEFVVVLSLASNQFD